MLTWATLIQQTIPLTLEVPPSMSLHSFETPCRVLLRPSTALFSEFLCSEWLREALNMNMRGSFIQDTDFSHLKTYIRLSGQESTLKYLLTEPKVRGRRALGKLFNVAPKPRSFVFVTSLPHPQTPRIRVVCSCALCLSGGEIDFPRREKLREP